MHIHIQGELLDAPLHRSGVRANQRSGQTTTHQHYALSSYALTCALPSAAADGGV